MSTEATEVVEHIEGRDPLVRIEPPKVDPGVQKRINELTFKHREQERRAQAAEAELAAYREREAKAKEKPAEPEKRKSLADFNYDEAEYDNYLEERATAKAEAAAAKKAKEAVVEHAQETERAKTEAERMAKWEERQAEFTKSHPDFDEVVEEAKANGLRLSGALIELLGDSEVGPAALMHLAKNIDESRRISALSPAAAGREFAKLEAKLATVSDEPKPADDNASAEIKDPPPRKPGPTPKLTATGEAGRKPSTTSKESDKLSDDEWFKAEQQRLATKRSRSNGQ